MRKFGFTLAEILITLGVIGVVAALTFPSFNHKYRSMVLQKQLLKSYSNLQQTILYMKKDLGIDNLMGEFVHYDAESGRYTDTELFYNEFDKYMKVVHKLNSSYPITNYSGTTTTTTSYGRDLPQAPLILADGSSVGRQINNHRLIFFIDVNGPYKRPNRLGFDTFEFVISDSSDFVKPGKKVRNYTEEELKDMVFPETAGWPCSKASNQLYNGMGCAWFAINDVNPDDSTKKYWNNLPW